jgi:hypothetical protein
VAAVAAGLQRLLPFVSGQPGVPTNVSRVPQPIVTVLAALACSAGAASAQQAVREGDSRTFASVRAAANQADGMGAQEVRLRWRSADPSAARAAAASEVRILRRQVVPGRIRGERNPELADDKLVVVSVGRTGAELDWRIVSDPTLVRSETADATGNLVRQDLRRTEGDLLVAIPDLPELSRLRLYRPRWNGREFVLDLIAALDLP